MERVDWERVGRVDPSYEQRSRVVRPRSPLVEHGAVIKWYEVFVATDLDGDALRGDARAIVEARLASGEVPVEHGFGLSVLHHSTMLDYVVLGTWHATQELWLDVHTRAADATGSFRRMTIGIDSSAFCTWELAPIWHEREAWVRYLRSDRDIAARRQFVADVLDGEAD